jgi:hypothetical protein
MKNSTNKRGFNPTKNYDDERQGVHGMLNSSKIEKLFRSNVNSDDSEDWKFDILFFISLKQCSVYKSSMSYRIFIRSKKYLSK